MAVVVGLLVFFAAEIAAIVEVGLHLGLFPTVALLVVISACGPLVLRRAGLTMWRQTMERLRQGEMPGRELRDGALLVVAGLLLCVPGFLSGALGGLLLLRPVRAGVGKLAGRWLLVRPLAGRARVVAARTRNSSSGGVDWPGDHLPGDGLPADHWPGEGPSGSVGPGPSGDG